jgi:hypothetical protein
LVRVRVVEGQLTADRPDPERDDGNFRRKIAIHLPATKNKVDGSRFLLPELDETSTAYFLENGYVCTYDYFIIYWVCSTFWVNFWVNFWKKILGKFMGMYYFLCACVGGGARKAV